MARIVRSTRCDGTGRPIFLVLSLVIATSHVLVAQPGLTAAGGTISILARDFSEVSLDAKESGATLVYKSGVSGTPAEWFNNAQLSLAAQKSKRDLFSKGELTPGIKVEDRFARSWTNLSSGGFSALFVSAGYEFSDRPIARYTDAAKTTMAIERKSGHALSVGAGLNWSPSTLAPVLGFSATLSRETSKPISKSAVQVCTTSASASDSKGRQVVAADCSDRFLGGVHDTRSGQFRLDLIGPRIWAKPRSGRVALHNDSVHVLHLDTVRRELKRRVADRKDALQRATAATATVIEMLRNNSTSREVTAYADAMAEQTRVTKQVQEATEALGEATDEYNREATRLKDNTRDYNSTPMISPVAAISANVERGAAPAYNAALGPAFHPPLLPEKVVAALLFELSDFTKSSNAETKFGDRFSARLYLGLPF